MKTVIIDNYDSFTYNLYHLIRETGTETTVLRNDAFDLKDIEAYDKIVLSPGPGIPEEAGQLLDVIRTYAGRKPILGVCSAIKPSARLLAHGSSTCPMSSTAYRLLVSGRKKTIFSKASPGNSR